MIPVYLGLGLARVHCITKYAETVTNIK